MSTEQACSNAETEVGSSSFEDIVGKSKALWNEKLSKIEIDVTNTNANITEMFYSSLYRSSLTPVSTIVILLLMRPHMFYDTEQRDRGSTRCFRKYYVALLRFFILQVSFSIFLFSIYIFNRYDCVQLGHGKCDYCLRLFYFAQFHPNSTEPSTP